MSKILCTFSGKFGDVIWSLPTVRAIALKYGTAVDFAMMPAYESLIPLLILQEYVDKAFVINEWRCTGSPFGDQPAEAPHQESYEKTYHLTYRGQPTKFLGDFIAEQAGVQLEAPIQPFISLPYVATIEYEGMAKAFDVAVGFSNPYEMEKKQALIDALKVHYPAVSFVDVTGVPWTQAAYIIREVKCFIGCRSSNHVLAHGVGTLPIIFEPHPHRNVTGLHFFKCRWSEEHDVNSIDEAKAILDKVLS